MTDVRIVLNATALRDANSITEHLKREAGPSVEKRFADELGRMIDLLASNPDIGRETTRPAVHVILMSSFPYHVIYRRARSDELRIRHTHRRPLTWL